MNGKQKRNQEHGELTEKHHFTVELGERELENLINDRDSTIETDKFVAKIKSPRISEINTRTIKNMIKELIEKV